MPTPAPTSSNKRIEINLIERSLPTTMCTSRRLFGATTRFNNRQAGTFFHTHSSDPSAGYFCEIFHRPHTRQEKIVASTHSNELRYIHDPAAHAALLWKRERVG